MLAARRRLLGMLLALTIGSGALAVTKMAAWWVIVPPTIMLPGYMLLLSEAAKVDAERRELARAAAAPGRPAPVRPAAPKAPPVPAAPPASAAHPASAAPRAAAAPVPNAEVIDISASLTPAGEQFYDQYADAKLRAVGDLADAPQRPAGCRAACP